jgi:hypothetical protein
VQAAEHHERRGDEPQLHDLGVGEEAAQRGHGGPVEARVVGGQALGEVQGRRLARRAVGGAGQLGQERLVESRSPIPGLPR